MIKDLLTIDLDHISYLISSDLKDDLHTSFLLANNNTSTKTFVTNSLKNILLNISNKLKNNIGSSCYKIVSKPGWGKSNALITILNYIKTYTNSSICVLSFANIDNNNTIILNNLLSKLGEHIDITSNDISHVGDTLRSILLKNSPLLILIDDLCNVLLNQPNELVNINISLFKILLDTVKSVNNCVLVFSMPITYDSKLSDILETFDKLTNRDIISYSTVRVNDLPYLIKQKFIESFNSDGINTLAIDYLNTLLKHKVITNNIESSVFLDKFCKYYPFHPDIFDIIVPKILNYDKSINLRFIIKLLACGLVLAYSNNRYLVTAGDIDISYMYDSSISDKIISMLPQNKYNIIDDIKNTNIKDTFNLTDFNIYSYFSNVLFWLSFDGNFIPLVNIKKQIPSPSFSPILIEGILEKLLSKHNYIHTQCLKYAYLSEPNKNKIYQDFYNSITFDEVYDFLINFLKSRISNKYMLTYIVDNYTFDVDDNKDLKLIIMFKNDETLLDKIKTYSNNSIRSYVNTLFFLMPNTTDYVELFDIVKHCLTLRYLINSDDFDKKENLDFEIKKYDDILLLTFFRIFNIVKLPNDSSYVINKPTVSKTDTIDSIVYFTLVGEKILDNISPITLMYQFLHNQVFCCVDSIYNSTFMDINSFIFKNRSVLEEAIKTGVRDGYFAVGVVDNGNVLNYKYCVDVDDNYLKNENLAIIDKKVILNEDTNNNNVLFNKIINISGKSSKIDNLITMLMTYKKNITSFSITLELVDLSANDLEALNKEF